MTHTGVALMLLVLAGIMNGSFALPMKFTRLWAWENTWLAWSVFALILLPIVVTFTTVPHVLTCLRNAGFSVVLVVVVCGAAWGVAQVAFGLAVEMLGLALSFSIVLGLSAAVGSVIPLINLHSDRVFSKGGMGVLTGIFLVLVGVALCAVAGHRREASLASGHSGHNSFFRGLAFAIGSGLGAAMVNLGLIFGHHLIEVAQQNGAAPVWAPNAVWLPLLLAGAVPNLFYCGYLMQKNRTTTRYVDPATKWYWLYAFVMAFFWFGSTSLYGISIGKLGSWGTIIGWPVFMSLIVITASLLGIATGEWTGTGKQPLRIQLAGVMVLVLAISLLSVVSRWV